MNEELKIKISAEVNKFKQGVSEAQKKITELQQKAGLSAKDIDEKFSKMGAGIKKAFVTAAKGTAAMVTALAATSKATEEYRMNQAKLETAFTTAGGSAKEATQTYNDLYRVLGDDGQTTEAAAHLAKLTTNQKDLSEWTKICEGVYATFGDSLPIEGLTEASNETVKTGKVTGVLADALNWAGVSEDEFNSKLAACNTEAEREQLLRETLSGLYDEAAAGYEKNAEAVLKQHEAQAKLNAALATVGEAFAPFLTAVMTCGAELLTTLSPAIESLGNVLLPVLEGALTAASDAFKAMYDWANKNPGVLTAIGVAIGVVTAAIGLYNAVAIVKAAMDAAQVASIGALISSYLAQAAAMMAALLPYLLIVAAITALIGVMIYLYQTNETFREVVNNVWTAVQEFIAVAVEFLSTLIQGFCEHVSAFWTQWGDTIMSVVSTVFTIIGTIIQVALTIVTGIIKAATQVINGDWEGAWNTVKETFSKVWDIVKDLMSKMLEKIKEIWGKIKEAISNKVQEAKDAVRNKFEEMKQAIQDKVQAAKEAVVNKFNEIKQNITDKVNGAKEAVTNSFNAIKENITEKMNGAKDKVKSAIDKMKSFFHFSWSLPTPSVPEFHVSGGKAPWGFMGKGSLPYINVEWHAKGGVFDAPTLFGYNGGLHGLGEDGAEAVVPLEKNTEWLDRIAERLNRNSDTPIVLQVDGKTFAETTIKTMNDLTKQTGKLGLNIY